MAYVIKVTIENTHPPVWRRIRIPENISFLDLHEIIQKAFGWENEHLHDFTFPVGDIEILQDGERGYGDSIEESIARVDDFLPCCKWIRYTYDFGDSWRHKIVLEKTEADSGEQRFAEVLKAKGDNFVEDTGGVWGAGEDDRLPFSLEKVNQALAVWNIPVHKRNRESEELAEELQTTESFRQNKKLIQKNMEQKLENMLQEFQNELVRETPLLGVDDTMLSSRDRMLKKLLARIVMLEAKNALLGDEPKLYVNIHEPSRTLEDMLTEHSDRTLEMFCGTLEQQAEDASAERRVAMICREYREHPECLLYMFREEELAYLKKLSELPPGRGVEMEVEKAEVIWRSILFGIADVNTDSALESNVLHLWLAVGVREMLARIPEEMHQYCGRLQTACGELQALVQTYAVIEEKALLKQHARLFGRKLNESDLRRLLYGQLLFRNGIYIYRTEDETEYFVMQGIDEERVLNGRAAYHVEVPYRQFLKKQLLWEETGVAERYPAWKEFADMLRDEYEMADEETDIWAEEEYVLIQNGASTAELYSDMEEAFEFSYISENVEMWLLYMDLWLNTPLPLLKGYSRTEYAKLTGEQPWELGVYDVDIEGKQIQADGIYRIPPRQQYELYCIACKEKPKAADVLEIEKIKAVISEKVPELDYIRAMTYLKNNKPDKAERLLRELVRETGDTVIQEILDMLREARRECFGEEWVPAVESRPVCRESRKIGRNEPCPCGSGKKFKKCCMGKGIYD